MRVSNTANMAIIRENKAIFVVNEPQYPTALWLVAGATHTPETYPIRTTLPNSVDYSSPKQGQIIIVEDNPDHWALMEAAGGQTMPGVELIWVTSTDRALAHLNACLAGAQPLPRLMLLDLYLPDPQPTWQLLRLIKQSGSPFVWMPVVVISYSVQPSDINDFYAFGGTSYIVKPQTYEQWVAYFESVRQYWWETVTLPRVR